ncbi:hypothetical protein BAURA63_03792 [Brevibacterium aurantiacum]|uniref:Uncharacterized protein n=2 Tax=Brevibacterium TaxID=1696 RepID=A0A2H1KV73_BREAU|nr:hypothetical protein BAUR9175_03379 [Brevibacterium aurantiacum]SMY01839.1 hypothetical protein BLIN9172_03428 [Brevibacterium linens ATCC 9172]SMY03559.1 hypothetical protein BAURA63_03792 [Brevibacterium aurantiacum]
MIAVNDKNRGREWNTLVDLVVSLRTVGESNGVLEKHYTPLVNLAAINSLPLSLLLRHLQTPSWHRQAK